ncbi:helix-turn-helix transcriptional regulator [Bosea sp. UNC402CLCol]|uniref:helix-turn-helix domain-containing protein n=1 Tax=Bosea sp. UNC402CLCol TaxID=1510531 RepID=UPI0009E0945F|nr:helix-turn-helix transcriptional regulator [Bosea sp. UNC402CLCol]
MDMRTLVGANFARLRKERGLTQEQIEERSGFSQWYISSLERGRRNPTVITLYELANALGVRVVDLLAETGGGMDVGPQAADESIGSAKSAPKGR